MEAENTHKKPVTPGEDGLSTPFFTPDSGGNDAQKPVTEEETVSQICGGCGLLPPALAPDIPRPWGLCRTCFVAEEAARASPESKAQSPKSEVP